MWHNSDIPLVKPRQDAGQFGIVAVGAIRVKSDRLYLKASSGWLSSAGYEGLTLVANKYSNRAGGKDSQRAHKWNADKDVAPPRTPTTTATRSPSTSPAATSRTAKRNEGGSAIFFVSNNKTGSITIKDSATRNNPRGTLDTPNLPGFCVIAKQPIVNSQIFR
ncbi:MAG TPA: hypothetical protein VK550_09535 [Polyangiaceae bacterium]|nr:hypothetical protein [Polyangiaceae bacterium]